LFASSALLAACSSSHADGTTLPEARPKAPGRASPPATPTSPPEFCSRPGDDLVRDVFYNDVLDLEMFAHAAQAGMAGDAR
jgi:hypothetical protein